jgi:hypothetical protein
MQNQTIDTRVLPMSRQALAVEEEGEREDVGMELKVQVAAVLSNGVVDIQGIREWSPDEESDRSKDMAHRPYCCWPTADDQQA